MCTCIGARARVRLSWRHRETHIATLLCPDKNPHMSNFWDFHLKMTLSWHYFASIPQNEGHFWRWGSNGPLGPLLRTSLLCGSQDLPEMKIRRSQIFVFRWRVVDRANWMKDLAKIGTVKLVVLRYQCSALSNSISRHWLNIKRTFRSKVKVL